MRSSGGRGTSRRRPAATATSSAPVTSIATPCGRTRRTDPSRLRSRSVHGHHPQTLWPRTLAVKRRQRCRSAHGHGGTDADAAVDPEGARPRLRIILPTPLSVIGPSLRSPSHTTGRSVYRWRTRMGRLAVKCLVGLLHHHAPGTRARALRRLGQRRRDPPQHHRFPRRARAQVAAWVLSIEPGH